jgi:hypothetical protein
MTSGKKGIDNPGVENGDDANISTDAANQVR